MENLREVIDECIADPRYAQGRAEVKAETWEHYSEGAVRTVDYLLNKYDELTKDETKKDSK
jgi:hypothetical protein